MSSQEPQGLMAFWTDIDHDYILEFQKWHNCEHMTERTSIPGFMVGRRYRGMDRAPMFFISYETSDSAVFKSQPYLDRLNDPTPWTKEALTHFNNNMRNIYRLLAGHGEKAPTEAPYSLVVRFNLLEKTESETLDWYANQIMPELTGLPGLFRARLYEVDEEISNLKTAERAIYGGGPGEQRYLAWYELASPDPALGPDWQAVRENPANSKMFGNRKDVFEELSWLEFVMYGPDQG